MLYKNVEVSVTIPVVNSEVPFLYFVNRGMQHDADHSCYCSKHCPYVWHRHPHWQSPGSTNKEAYHLKFKIWHVQTMKNVTTKVDRFRKQIRMNCHCTNYIKKKRFFF